MKIFPSLRRFARSIEEKGRTSRNGIVLALRLHFWSRVGQLPTPNRKNTVPESGRLKSNATVLSSWPSRCAPTDDTQVIRC